VFELRPSRTALLLGGWLTIVAPAPQAEPQRDAVAASEAPQPPIVVEAAYSHVDYKTNTVLLRDVVVSQGDTRVTAARAHGMGVGFDSSEWTFEGAVHMVLQPRGTLNADQAVVQFRNGRITQATATGKPARFQQQPSESHRATYGSADEIHYDAANDSVRLSGDAWVSDGRGVEISGPVVLYNILDEHLQATSPVKGRVHITVTPRTRPK